MVSQSEILSESWNHDLGVNDTEVKRTLLEPAFCLLYFLKSGIYIQ